MLPAHQFLYSIYFINTFFFVNGFIFDEEEATGKVSNQEVSHQDVPVASDIAIPNDVGIFPLKLRKEDTKKNILLVDSKRFSKLTNSKETVIVAFLDRREKVEWTHVLGILDQISGSLRLRHVVIATVDLSKLPDLANREGLASQGSLMLYKEGQKIAYHGILSAEAITQFVYKCLKPNVQEIRGKVEKRAFDYYQTTKVVAFFTEKDKAYDEFKHAANHFHPYIPFYVTFDPTVAKHLRIDEPGTVLLRKTYDRVPLPVAENPASSTDIIHFIEDNKKSVVSHAFPYNFKEFQSYDPDKPFLLALLGYDSPWSYSMSRLLRKLFRNEYSSAHLQMYVIDSKDFIQMVPFWEDRFSIDLSRSAIGLINITHSKAVWFDIETLESCHLKHSRYKLVKNWIDAILARQIRVDGLTPEAPPSDEIEEIDCSMPPDEEEEQDEPQEGSSEQDEPQEGSSEQDEPQEGSRGQDEPQEGSSEQEEIKGDNEDVPNLDKNIEKVSIQYNNADELEEGAFVKQTLDITLTDNEITPHKTTQDVTSVPDEEDGDLEPVSNYETSNEISDKSQPQKENLNVDGINFDLFPKSDGNFDSLTDLEFEEREEK